MYSRRFKQGSDIPLPDNSAFRAVHKHSSFACGELLWLGNLITPREDRGINDGAGLIILGAGARPMSERKDMIDR